MNLLSPTDATVSSQFNSEEGFVEARVTATDLQPDSHYYIDLYEIYNYFGVTERELNAGFLHLGKKILTLNTTHCVVQCAIYVFLKM